MRRAVVAILVLLASTHIALRSESTSDDFLGWTAEHAEKIGRLTYRRGRVGGFWDTRLLKTERSYNYKLAGTWLTPETIRATARLIQLRSRLTSDETLKLVNEAEVAGATVIMIDIDPREGSGVIPNDWEAFLQPKDNGNRAIRGEIVSKLRDVRALSGVLRRNYDYDRFWTVFSLASADGSPLFSDRDTHAELVVRIYNNAGRIDWPIPPSIRQKVATGVGR